MPVISSETNAEALTMTLVVEVDANVERAWQLWEDPRQLERWWGPPTWPATFRRHDFATGGGSHYFMTGPEGEQAHGWWKMTAVEKPHRLEIEDGFADENGEPTGSLGSTRFVVTFDADGRKTRMTTVSQFESAEQLQQMLEMGMEEGMLEGAGQIDALIAEDRAA